MVWKLDKSHCSMFLSKFMEIYALGFCIMRRLPNKNLRGSLKTDLRFARPKIRGSTERAKRRSDGNVVKIAFLNVR